MFSVEKYIDIKFKDAKYSEVFYIQSDAGGVLNQEFGQEGIRGILYHHIYWIPIVGQIIFKDQFGQVLFIAAGTSGDAPMPLVQNGITLNITSSNAAFFSVSFQKIL